MKGALGTLLAFAGALNTDSHYMTNAKNSLRPEDIDMTPPKRVIPKGCSVYNIEGVEIVALNEKSALKKYKNSLK